MKSENQEPSSVEHHKKQASNQESIPIGLVTVSDTRTPESDQNFHYLKEKIEQKGHEVADYKIVKDEPQEIINVLEELAGSKARVIIFNGGTGISKRDTTFDVINSKLEKVLPGFGELFRMLSYEEVGAAAMLSRAVAGLYKDTVIFSIPGSPNAVKVAWEKLIEKELQHLAWEILR